MDEIGYDVEWKCINGKYFLPQNRERVFIIGHLRGKPIKPIFSVRCDDQKIDEIRPSVRTLTGGAHSGGLHSQMTMIAWSKSTRDWGVESRIKEGEANTINTGQGGSTQSSMTLITDKKQYRRLTPLECERLQGFPDGWTDGLSDTQRYKCLGNAVMIPVIEYIAKHFPITELMDCE